MNLIDAMSLPKSLHQNSLYEDRTIDIGLLVKDYLYIYNYLTADTREDIQYTNPLYYRALDISLTHSAPFLNWTLYSNEYNEDLFYDMTLRNQERDYIAHMSNLIRSFNGLSAPSIRKVYMFRRFDIFIDSTPSIAILTNNIEEAISERLFIIEDYIDTQTIPDKCENLNCYECIFEQTCTKRYEDTEPPF